MDRKHSRILLLFLMLPLLDVPSALAETITFDDLDPFYSQEAPISDYAGLTWKNFYSMNVSARYASSYATGYFAGMVSAPFVAYNSNGDVAEFSADTPFTFVSASLAAAWLDGLEITVEGYLDSTLVESRIVKVSPTASQLFTFDYKGVNRVVFTPSGGTPLKGFTGSGTFFVMDNLEIAYDDPESTSITIDIKPGDGPNAINPSSKGVTPVAILTTGSFNATTVDPMMVRFGPDMAPSLKAALEDANGDGQLDMVLFFQTRRTGISCGDTSATLRVIDPDGQVLMEGTDSIRTVPCK
jgi:hypothetical protein